MNRRIFVVINIYCANNYIHMKVGDSLISNLIYHMKIFLKILLLEYIFQEIYISNSLDAMNSNVRYFMYLRTLEFLSEYKILKRFSCDCSPKKSFMILRLFRFIKTLLEASVKLYVASRFFLLFLLMIGTAAQSAVPRIKMIPKARKMGLYESTFSKITPHTGGPTSCRTPLTNNDIP